jgi:hypothetical protein
MRLFRKIMQRNHHRSSYLVDFIVAVLAGLVVLTIDKIS